MRQVATQTTDRFGPALEFLYLGREAFWNVSCKRAKLSVFVTSVTSEHYA